MPASCRATAAAGPHGITESIHHDGRERHSTRYWMNKLQEVSENENYLVSIDPPAEIDEEKIIRHLDYEHPVFGSGAIAAQGKIPELHLCGHKTGPFYCGAWQRYGFHGDGIWSARRLCQELSTNR